MGTRNALLRLQENLRARKERLGMKLAAELAYLHDGKAADATGDSADLAFEAGGDEVSSRLAELGDRELSQVERALARCQLGVYGICEGGGKNCQKKIPVARLNALPYTPYCIHCERELEKYQGSEDHPGTGNWGQVSDAQAPMQDRRFNLSKLERDLAGSRAD